MTSNDLEKKYEHLLSPNDAYTFFLRVQNDIRKSSKNPNIEEFFKTIKYAISHLSKLNEGESCISLLNFSLTQYIKNYKAKENIELFLQNFMELFEMIPEQCDKATFKRDFLKYYKEQNISEYLLEKYRFYELFAKDALKNKNLVEAYKFAIKSQDYDTIDQTVEKMISPEMKTSNNERNLIIARVVFELILVKNLKLAYKFISKYIDKTDNFNNNPPALNFAFMLVSLITRAMHDFDHFWALINIYKGVCEQEYYIQYYLNKISIMYYNRPFLKEEDNSSFNLMNIMKSFGFGGGQ